jgi:PEP-CTERM motif
MKFNPTLIAVAAAMLSAAGAANAAPTTNLTNSGSLVIGAFNVSTNAWYLRDTGYLLNSFLPSGVTTLSGDGSAIGNKTPADGLTITKATTATFGDASFGNWLIGQTQSDVRWFVSAADTIGDATVTGTNRKRLITSSANAAQAATNDNVAGYVAPTAAGGIGSLYQSGSNGSLSSTGTGAPSGFANNFGLGATSLASLGNSVGLFYFSMNSSAGGSAASKTQFGNATGNATVTLAANGDFTYALASGSAVPEPAAVWLLGSGLLAFGSFVRRRTVK